MVFNACVASKFNEKILIWRIPDTTILSPYTWEDDWRSDSRNSPGDSFVNNPMSCHYMIYTTRVFQLSFSLAHCICICICIIVYVYYGVKFGSWLLWLPILILASDASALEHWKTFAKCGFHMKYIWKYIIYKYEIWNVDLTW